MQNYGWIVSSVFYKIIIVTINSNDSCEDNFVRQPLSWRRNRRERGKKNGAPDNPIHAPIQDFRSLRNISADLLDSTMLRLHNTVAEKEGLGECLATLGMIQRHAIKGQQRRRKQWDRGGFYQLTHFRGGQIPHDYTRAAREDIPTTFVVFVASWIKCANIWDIESASFVRVPLARFRKGKERKKKKKYVWMIHSRRESREYEANYLTMWTIRSNENEYTRITRIVLFLSASCFNVQNGNETKLLIFLQRYGKDVINTYNGLRALYLYKSIGRFGKWRG